ncbi:MAG: peptidoglycan-associated lipoprotein [Kiritimatiellia bacterium]|jgi:peptidoglycan-associated lipoprotein
MHKLRIVLIAAMAAALVLNTGCKKPKAGAGAGSDLAGTYAEVDGNYDLDPLGQIVGANGEPLAGRPLQGNQFTPDIHVQNVLFGYNSSSVEPSERPKVQVLADYLLQTPGVTVTIEGHCDERGSLDYNLALGERRALAIRDYMLQMGVTGDRITTLTFGEEMPMAYGHDEASYSQNRRGEFKFYRM